MLELVCRATRYEPAVTRQVRAVRAKQVQGGHNGRTFYEAQDAHSGEWIAFCKADNGPLVRRGVLPAFCETDFGGWQIERIEQRRHTVSGANAANGADGVSGVCSVVLRERVTPAVEV